jgi:LuxR family maltose regulon positive regulatory protein
MYSPLLQTKLFVPLARPDLVPRPHLLNKLNGGLSGKLTLISAPAGYGKTTLLSDWIDQSDIPFCWLALEENDNDVVRFLTYFTAALQTIEAGIGEQIVSLLHSPQEVPYETILIPLLNQVAQTGNHFALVLDDYHLIEGKDIQDALAFWLEHQPPTMHLVIASRSDPPLPLAKMRARREMMEVREADLRFSLDEADKLLNQVQNLNLSARDLQALTDRTEGWIVGLQMASFALMGNEDTSDYIQRFTGSHEYVADYLKDEVMNQLSDRVREFLLKTSILDRLTGRLCDAVANQTNSQHTLKQLKSSNLFLTSLDDESLWYQYHHLFADLLRQQLLESDADSVPSLYLRASHWFENNGYHPEAIEYALRGKHFERAIALIEQEAEQTLKRSEITTFLQWINRLPDELVK